MASSRKPAGLLTPSMDLWRISNYHTLDGGGGRKYPGRWHSAGEPIVYLASSAPGALLETLVHLRLDADDLPPSYMLMRIAVPAKLEYVELQPVGDHWQKDVLQTQKQGDRWLKIKSSVLAVVPSAIMPHSTNWLMNPEHPDARRIHIADVFTADYDERLLRLRSAARRDKRS